MKPPVLAVRRPVLSTVASLTLIVLGLASLLITQVRQYPDVDPPVVSITTAYRGAPAPVVDADVTKRIVDELSGIEDIEVIDARSADSTSRIDVRFRLRRNLDLAAADVRDRVNRVRADLPERVEDPIIRKASADASPIMWITLRSEERSPLQLSDFADRFLSERLSIVSGVAEVILGGERRYAMRIEVDPDQMAARNVAISDIVQRLREENIEVPAGRIESRAREFAVRVESRLPDAEAFGDLVIREEGEGRVRLRDVADVFLGAETRRNLLRISGENAVGLGVVRQSNANTLGVTDRVKAELERLRPSIPDEIDVRISFDTSVFIRQSIRGVLTTLGIAIGVVIFVIFLFLGSVRAALIPAAAIPISLLATGIALQAFGYTINVLTLLAAVLAIGLLVDDAVVVLENIERRQREGEPLRRAAARGGAQIAFAVIATTAVLVAVFAPIAFLSGRTGRLFAEFSLALAAAVVFSTFVALTLVPTLCSLILKPTEEQRSAEEDAGSNDGLGARLASIGASARSAYERFVGGAVTIRFAFLLLIAGAGAAAGWLLVSLPTELAPPEDRGDFRIIVEAPEGSSVEYMAEELKRIDDLLYAYEQETAGERGALFTDTIAVVPGFIGAQTLNTAVVIVKLVDWGERSLSQQTIVDELRPRLLAMPGARSIPVNPPSLGVRSGGQQIKFAVGAPDFDSARDYAQRILDDALAGASANLFADLRITQARTKPQMRLTLDRDKAAELGLTPDRLGLALQTALGGLEVTEFLDRGELYEVVVQAQDADRADLEDLLTLRVRAEPSGELIPLESVATAELRGAVRELRRVNRSPSVVLSGSVAPGASLGEALAALEEIARTGLPDDLEINYLGRSLEFKQATAQFLVALALALILGYLVLAAQFESFIDPITILITAPVAGLGGLAALWATGISLNIYSQIGLVMLVGLTTKNGILMVEFANQLREQGRSIRDASIQAASVRLRPILMTGLSTIAGAVPLVLATGAAAEGRRAIGFVIVGGMGLSALLTLFLTPSVYALLAPLTRAKRTKSEPEEQEQSRRAPEPQRSGAAAGV